MSPAARAMPTLAVSHVVRASAVAPRAVKLLDATSPEIGRVHSVFDRALNVLCRDGRLLALHGPGPVAAPFAIAIDERVDWREIDCGTRVARNVRGDIAVDGLRIATAGSRIAETGITPGAWRALASALADGDEPDTSGARCAGPASPAGVGQPALASPLAREAMRHISDGIRHADASELLAGGRALIGLGEGLTPAGDDVLVGVLAVIHRARPLLLSGAPDVVATLAHEARARTTAIAREFVLHALDGHFSEPIVQLATADDSDRARDALRHVLSMGATSGADTVVGLRLAARALSR